MRADLGGTSGGVSFDDTTLCSLNLLSVRFGNVSVPSPRALLAGIMSGAKGLFPRYRECLLLFLSDEVRRGNCDRTTDGFSASLAVGVLTALL